MDKANEKGMKGVSMCEETNARNCLNTKDKSGREQMNRLGYMGHERVLKGQNRAWQGQGAGAGHGAGRKRAGRVGRVCSWVCGGSGCG